jgi:hypothetical protein
LVIISPDGLHNVVGIAGYEPLEGFHVTGEVEVDSFSRPLS